MKNAKSVNSIVLSAGVVAAMALVATGLVLAMSGGAYSNVADAHAAPQIAQPEVQDPADAFRKLLFSTREQAATRRDDPALLDDAALTDFCKVELENSLAAVSYYPKSEVIDEVLWNAAELAAEMEDYAQAERLALQASGESASWRVQLFWLSKAAYNAQAMQTQAATQRAADYYRRGIALAVLPAHRYQLNSSLTGTKHLTGFAHKLAWIETMRSNYAAALQVLTPVREVIAKLPQPLQTRLAESNAGVEGLAGMEINAAAADGQLERGIAALLVIEALDTKLTPASSYANQFAENAIKAGKVYADSANMALAALKPDSWTPGFELRIAMDYHMRGLNAQALAIAEKLLKESIPALEAIDARGHELVGTTAQGSGGHRSALYATVAWSSLALGDIDRAETMLKLLTEQFPLDPQTKAVSDSVLGSKKMRARSPVGKNADR